MGMELKWLKRKVCLPPHSRGLQYQYHHTPEVSSTTTLQRSPVPVPPAGTGTGDLWSVVVLETSGVWWYWRPLECGGTGDLWSVTKFKGRGKFPVHSTSYIYMCTSYQLNLTEMLSAAGLPLTIPNQSKKKKKHQLFVTDRKLL